MITVPSLKQLASDNVLCNINKVANFIRAFQRLSFILFAEMASITFQGVSKIFHYQVNILNVIKTIAPMSFSSGSWHFHNFSVKLSLCVVNSAAATHLEVSPKLRSL